MYALKTLEATFLKWAVETAGPDRGRELPDGTMQWGGFDIDTFHCVERLEDADGISFLCPKCFETLGHSIHVYFEGRNTPAHLGKNKKGETVRWKIAGGTSLDDLQLTPSILLEAGACDWHGFVGTSGIPPGHAG